MEKIIHPIPPLYDGASKILILGSFPSVKSREGLFFYHHPQNRFWKVLAAVLGAPVPASIEEKRQFLISSHIAVWDVIASCTITGSTPLRFPPPVPPTPPGPCPALRKPGPPSCLFYKKSRNRLLL